MQLNRVNEIDVFLKSFLGDSNQPTPTLPSLEAWLEMASDNHLRFFVNHTVHILIIQRDRVNSDRQRDRVSSDRQRDRVSSDRQRDRVRSDRQTNKQVNRQTDKQRDTEKMLNQTHKQLNRQTYTERRTNKGAGKQKVRQINRKRQTDRWTHNQL